MKSNEKALAFFLCLLFLFTGCSLSSPKGIIMDITPEPKKLTLMVYMAADNELESNALKNLKAMEKADYEGINVLVLLDRSEGYDETDGDWTDTRLFEVVHDSGNGNNIISKRLDCPPLGLSSSVQTELDTGDMTVLERFIEFCKESYEAEKYALIIWGHGGGWSSFAFDDRTLTAMSVKNLGRAVEGKNLCVIGFDTCCGGAIENIYELKDAASYITASPGMTPSEGWNYKMLLEELDDDDIEPKDIASAMCRSSSVTACVFKTSEVKTLFESLEDFAREVSLTVTDSQSRQDTFETLFSSKSYSDKTYPCDMFIDIRCMAGQFTSSQSQALKSAAVNLVQAVDDAVRTTDGSAPVTGVNFIPLESANIAATSHVREYIKDPSSRTQCSFVKQSEWWVPTAGGNSGSLLDKLFYTVF